MNMKKRLVLLAPVGILGMLLFVGLGGVVVQQLWNWLLPSMFGWPQITFWQAVGMLGLCRILVGGFGLHGSPRSHFRHRLGESAGRTWCARTGNDSAAASTSATAPDHPPAKPRALEANAPIVLHVMMNPFFIIEEAMNG
jgi:hypothetical protein